MDPKLPASFWSRRELENVPPDVLLAAAWLHTNPRLTLVGYATLSTRHFVFETRLKPEALEQACKALGKGLVRASEGYWLRSFIGDQFGRGASLAKNHMAKALVRCMEGLPSPSVGDAIVQEYPELFPLWHDVREAKGLVRPRKGATKPQSIAEQSRTEHSIPESGGAGGGRSASDRESERSLPEQLDVPEFREAWTVWVDYVAEKNGGRLAPQQTYDAHLRACLSLGPVAGAAALRTAIERNLRAPADAPKISPGGPVVPFDPSQNNAHTGGAEEAR